MSEIPKLRKRRALKHKEIEKLLEEISNYTALLKEDKIEEAVTSEGTIVYLLNSVLQFFRFKDTVYPTLRCNCVDRLPSVIVDMGAVPYVCKGADIMAPGIKELSGEFPEGAIVVIRDINYKKALAIGKALKNFQEIKITKKGKVITNLHYVGDEIWQSSSS